ncbi:MAG: GntR family transcriptional regulator [Deltaproteobacteria bacterium]|nr:GntR family transcriptional regulator [Deltaproteobacteria bacterium]MBW2139070.1 GntR family transcriptional regulator [Deltaproteobacteria bacterium]
MARKSQDRENLRIKAYKEIRDRILMFELRPGEKIFEKDLAQSLKVSRTPVREALLILERERLVECDERLGFIVRRMQVKEIDEFFQIRELLEVYAAPLIIKRILPSEIAALEKNIRKTSNHLEKLDYRNFVRGVIDFHEILWRSVKSELFFQVISGLSDMFIWFRALTARNREEMAVSLKGHKSILAAIRSKNTEELISALRNHLSHSKESNKIIHGFLFG